MSDAVERLLNLALYLADAREPVTAERIRADVAGYPAGQDEAAFLRMFERDKDQLREAGFLIESTESGLYLLDRPGTFASPVDLTAEETAVVATVATAMLADPSFPYADDLRFALAKIATGVDATSVPAAAILADEDPARQGESVAELSSAASRGKVATFEYTNSYGRTSTHEVEPYGLFLHDGRWYLVGRDTARNEERTYAVARIASLAVESARPATRDFERRDDFDVRTYVRLPFQYGDGREFTAKLVFEPSAAWRAEALAAGNGKLLPAPGRDDCALLWEVPARSSARLARFVIENGPGISVAPDCDGQPHVSDVLREGLAKVVALHG